MGSSQRFVSGYTDRDGIDSRACAALGTLELIVNDLSIPVAARLALVARRMQEEPICSDVESPEAYKVRQEAAAHATKCGMQTLTRGWTETGGQPDQALPARLAREV